MVVFVGAASMLEYLRLLASGVVGAGRCRFIITDRFFSV